ncbi:MAG: curli biogenesis system outer membrane secretion channel CsgG [Flavobacteriales bacterium]|jgi:curli biogenesis system outer membrane secretion channel CsgG
MKKLLATLALTGLAALLSPSTWAEVRIAIMDFDNRSQHGGHRLGEGAADILTTELVQNTDFNIFERDRLNNVISEQDMGNSGRFDNSSAAKLGKLIGVQFVVTGAITEYGESKSSIGARNLFTAGKKGYYAGIDIRVIDANTGRIMLAESGQGSKTSKSIRVMGIGGGEKWNEKHATAALRQAVKEVAKKLASADLSPGARGPVEMLVADVDGSVITLNQGSGAGLANGDVLTIKRQGKVIKDPSTGAIIKIKYKTIGQIKLTEVEAGYSEGKVISGNGFNNGDKAIKSN